MTPLEIDVMEFRLVFNRTGEVLVIEQPDGFSDLKIKVRGKRYARMIDFPEAFTLNFFTGKSVERGYHRLVEEFELVGFEADVNLEILVNGSVIFTGELQFESVDWNAQLERIELEVENLTIEKRVERLEDKAVNMLATETVNGQPIDPLPLADVELKAKEILERAVYEIGDVDGEPWSTWVTGNNQISGNNVPTNATFWSTPFGNLVLDQAGSSENYSFFGFGGVNPDPNQGGVAAGITIDNGLVSVIESYSLYNLKTEVEKKVKIKINEIQARFNKLNGGISALGFRLLILEYDQDFNNWQNGYYEVIPTNNTDINANLQEGEVLNYEIELNLPAWSTVTLMSTLTFNGTNHPDNLWEIDNSTIDLDSVDLFPDTTCKMARLIDVGKKIIENYTDGQANVVSPMFELNQRFYDYYLTNGYYIRGFEDEPFTINWKDWKQWVETAFNCDVEHHGNTIFVGRHEEFYNETEMLRLPYIPDVTEVSIKSDESRQINGFNLEYENYEDDDKNNTLDAFHTELQGLIPNKKVGESKEIKLSFTADAYAIEFARREGINREPTTAKPEDNNIYIIDVITQGQQLTNRTNQGFENIINLFSPETTYNLSLSPKRLILEHWGHFIAESGQHLENGNPTDTTPFLKVQYFKANGEMGATSTQILSRVDFPITETETVTGVQLPEPLIDNRMYEVIWGGRLKWETWVDLVEKINTQRGYITLFDENGNEIKLYPTEGTEFSIENGWQQGELKIIGKRKYE